MNYPDLPLRKPTNECPIYSFGCTKNFMNCVFLEIPKLTGLWNSTSFKTLTDALGNNSASAGNQTLKVVDMSKAEIAVGTNLNTQFPGALWGTVTKGIFQACKTLEEVIMPEASQAASFRSIDNAFYNCESLLNVDLSGLTGINSSNDAFYG